MYTQSSFFMKTLLFWHEKGNVKKKNSLVYIGTGVHFNGFIIFNAETSITIKYVLMIYVDEKGCTNLWTHLVLAVINR